MKTFLLRLFFVLRFCFSLDIFRFSSLISDITSFLTLYDLLALPWMCISGVGPLSFLSYSSARSSGMLLFLYRKWQMQSSTFGKMTIPKNTKINPVITTIKIWPVLFFMIISLTLGIVARMLISVLLVKKPEACWVMRVHWWFNGIFLKS